MIDQVMTINSVQKSSKSELSSRFFGRLKILATCPKSIKITLADSDLRKSLSAFDSMPLWPDHCWRRRRLSTFVDVRRRNVCPHYDPLRITILRITSPLPESQPPSPTWRRERPSARAFSMWRRERPSARAFSTWRRARPSARALSTWRRERPSARTFSTTRGRDGRRTTTTTTTRGRDGHNSPNHKPPFELFSTGLPGGL